MLTASIARSPTAEGVVPPPAVPVSLLRTGLVLVPQPWSAELGVVASDAEEAVEVQSSAAAPFAASVALFSLSSAVFFSRASFARRFSVISAAAVALSSALAALADEVGALFVFAAVDVVAIIICFDSERLCVVFGFGGGRPPPEPPFASDGLLLGAVSLVACESEPEPEL